MCTEGDADALRRKIEPQNRFQRPELGVIIGLIGTMIGASFGDSRKDFVRRQSERQRPAMPAGELESFPGQERYTR